MDKQLEYVKENIIPRIASGELESGEIVFEALPLWEEVKPGRALSFLIEAFKPLCDGSRYVHIREDYDQSQTIITPQQEVKRVEHRPVSRYVVSWLDAPEAKRVRGHQETDSAGDIRRF